MPTEIYKRDSEIVTNTKNIETKIDIIDTVVDSVETKIDIIDPIVDETLEEAEYIEHHLHRTNRTFGISADQSGNNWATEDSLLPFTATSGNADYGSDPGDEAKVFGSDDTPFIVGHNKFDPGYLLVTGCSNDDIYIIRLVWGTGTMADAIAAGQYSTIPYRFDSINLQVQSANTLFPIGNKKLDVGTKIWIQIKSSTDNATLDFMFNAHGYF